MKLPVTYIYPAELEREEEGRFIVTFPDFGWGATDGETREVALVEAQDLLRELLSATMREGKAIPLPSKAANQTPSVSPPVSIVLKAALYDATHESGLSQRQLARNLDVTENELRRMLNPDHATRTSTLESVLRRRGKQISVTVS